MRSVDVAPTSSSLWETEELAVSALATAVRPGLNQQYNDTHNEK